MGARERREREKAELRAKIMDAARAIFAERGYEAVTMRQIAERIEYSPTAIYFHFKDKESLIQELCARDFLSLAQAFGRLKQIADPVDRLRHIGRKYVEFATEHPNQYQLMFMTPTPPFEPSVTSGNPEETAYQVLRGTVAEGIKTGRFLPEFNDAELVTQLVWAGVHGVISLHIAKAHDPWVEWRDAKNTADTMVDVLIRGITRT